MTPLWSRIVPDRSALGVRPCNAHPGSQGSMWSAWTLGLPQAVIEVMQSRPLPRNAAHPLVLACLAFIAVVTQRTQPVRAMNGC